MKPIILISILFLTSVTTCLSQELYPAFVYEKAKDTVYYNRAWALAEQENYDEALKVLRKLGNSHSNDAATLQLQALCYQNKNDYGRAMDCIGLAIAAAPGSYGLLKIRAELWRLQDNQRAHAADLSAYLFFNREDLSAAYDYATALHNINDRRRAIDFLLALKRKDGDLYNLLAIYLVEDQNYESAISTLNEALLNDPEHESTYPNLAIAYKHARQDELALDTINKFLVTSPHHGHAYAIKGWICEGLGWFSDAENNYRLARKHGYDVDEQ